jgi:hypothetical protein
MARGIQMSSQGNNSWDAVLNRWTPSHQNTWDPKDPLGSLPRAVFDDPAGNNRYSDRFVQNAGFFRLKNIMLGYTVPQEIATKLKYFERLRVYISGSNMFTLTQWDGLDPEVDNDGLPTPRTWTFGVNATF